MKVSIYARYSTDLQDKTSIDGQISNCEALAARESLQVVDSFKDAGISGNDDSRPQYQEMLKRLNQGEFAGIVCDETSRITRNQAELHRLVAEMRFRDQFLITGDGVDTRNDSAELVLAVKAAVDSMEGRKIGYRTYRSLRERHKAGRCAGGKIFGYRTEKDGDYRKRVIWPEQSETIREIFERYAAGESAKSIVRDFNERGIPSPGSYWKNVKRRSIGWSHTTLLGSHTKASGILRNSCYAGRPAWNKRIGKKVPGTGRRIQRRRDPSEWIEVVDESLRIVSDDLFERVQVRLKAARENSSSENRRGRPPRYLFSGILKCASCGGNYSVRNGRHYSCSSQSNGRDALCSQRRLIRKAVIENELLADIKSQLLEPKFVREIGKRIRRECRGGGNQSKVERQLADVDGQIENVVESLASIGNSNALTDKLGKLERRRREVQQELDRAASTSDLIILNPADTWREVVSNLANLHERARPDEIETARKALQGIIGEVRIVEENDHVIAYPKLGNNVVYKSGAEKRT